MSQTFFTLPAAKGANPWVGFEREAFGALSGSEGEEENKDATKDEGQSSSEGETTDSGGAKSVKATKGKDKAVAVKPKTPLRKVSRLPRTVRPSTPTSPGKRASSSTLKGFPKRPASSNASASSSEGGPRTSESPTTSPRYPVVNKKRNSKLVVEITSPRKKSKKRSGE